MKSRPAVSKNILSRLKPEVATGLAEYIRLVVGELGEYIETITLYGSQARGEALADSDVDLFIVIRHDSLQVRSRLADIAWQVQYEQNIVISDIIRSAEEMRSSPALQFPYYRNLRNEGIILWKNTSVPTPVYA